MNHKRLHNRCVKRNEPVRVAEAEIKGEKLAPLIPTTVADVVEANEHANKIWFSAYMVSDCFLKTVVDKYGKNDLVFRDLYNYRNLRKAGIPEPLKPSCDIPSFYEDFPKRTVDYYVSAIGKDKFRKCLEDPRLNIETLFDEKDFFIDCRDVLDFWTNCDEFVTAKEDFHRYDFVHYLMEELDDYLNNPGDPPFECGKLFYVFRETVKNLDNY